MTNYTDNKYFKELQNEVESNVKEVKSVNCLNIFFFVVFAIIFLFVFVF